MPSASASDARSRIEHAAGHDAGARRSPFCPPAADLLRIGSRRWFVQTGLAGLAGLSTVDLLRAQAYASASGSSAPKRAVLLFWLSGGPSHLDMWDPKPTAPSEVRGPSARSAAACQASRSASICRRLPRSWTS